MSNTGSQTPGRMSFDNDIRRYKGMGKVAMVPPMGWNSWDCYGAAVNEEQVRANADT